VILMSEQTVLLVEIGQALSGHWVWMSQASQVDMMAAVPEQTVRSRTFQEVGGSELSLTDQQGRR
jgi:hypothetical protein